MTFQESLKRSQGRVFCIGCFGLAVTDFVGVSKFRLNLLVEEDLNIRGSNEKKDGDASCCFGYYMCCNSGS